MVLNWGTCCYSGEGRGGEGRGEGRGGEGRGEGRGEGVI